MRTDATERTLRVALVADGDTLDRRTNSGVALGLHNALMGLDGVAVVQAVNSRPNGIARTALLMWSFRPGRRWWWSNFNLGFSNILLRSIIRNKRLSTIAPADVVIHIRNIYFPARTPYAAFIDQTTMMANTGWANWRPTKVLQLIRRHIEKRYYERALVVLTAGQNAARSLLEDYRLNPSNVVAVGGGVNLSELPPITHTKAERLDFLWIGLDWARKGGDLTIEAFRQVRAIYPNAELTMVGGSGQPAEPGVTLLPPIFDADKLSQLYSASSIFVHPARHEPYGLVVQEAMAFAKACIVTDVGALSDIVEDECTGLVVPDGSSEKLAAAMIELASDPDKCRLYGDAGRAKVERSLTWQAVASRVALEIRARIDAPKEV